MKKYKVAFFTESGFYGKISRTYNNARTDIAWMIALNATHIPIYDYKKYSKIENFDIGIIIIPKKEFIINKFLTENFINEIKSFCSQVAIMQEGPQWYFQNYSIYIKNLYYKLLLNSDFILCHNEIDKKYYYGLTLKKFIYKMPSLIIEDTIKNLIIPNKNKLYDVIIGGNFTSWHNGFDSYIVATEINKNEIYCPSMGEMQPDEKNIINLKHISYLNWTDWMNELNKFRYGIHLMRVFAAGTFNLNCAYLQIPCIGYSSIDTQRILHLPELTINEIGDIYTARKIAKKLKSDKILYSDAQQYSREQYLKYYSESIFISNMNFIFEEVLSK